ncbi:LytR/AlgR family response regulator transcription factor [Flavihumibacter profundi]|uniref:LytR/AlgR family response regulator transcription factor n=1 Tax=Flavihumibacter profundi TaxID=2716883 RepID=UPI001CC82602|nr:LytTR family DNA-binding domain-containing protein [Flavihumibacter profundi]MBZ5857173.1 LytTR family DNA-binding domain-containing protein [Flavihumibacter profundi]
MIKAIIIDDEPNCCKTLSLLLNRYCPEVQVTGVFNNGKDALKAIETASPDLVFLDVEMPKMNGFEMLEQLPAINFHLVFTTSYDQYALKAFRFSAIDYLLKPIDREELQNAVRKIVKRNEITGAEQLQVLFQKLHHPAASVSKIALPTMEGLQMIPVNSIISCEANDNYTTLVLKGNKKLVVSITLKAVEDLLDDYSFIRVHRSFLVNIDEVEKFVKADGGYVVMSDGQHIYISKNKKEELLQKLLKTRG